MPILRSLTTKIKTKISPSSSPASSPTSSPGSSPDTSPTSPQTSSFEVIGGRKEGGIGITVKRPETHTRADSFMMGGSNASKESVERTEMKQRRISRFREELDVVGVE